MSSTAPVLVTGATGHQGGFTARALLAAGHPVRALVRNPQADAALAIEALGAELVQADLSDRSTLDRAVEGAGAVFSVQMPPMSATGVDHVAEVTQARNLIDAAKAAGVRHFVQSSTSGVGTHTEAPGWADGRWAAMEGYYGAKQQIIDAVRAAGFERWTVIKPAFFVENLPALMPHGPERGLVTILSPDAELALVSGDDIGAAVARAIAEPDRFHGVELELAGDRLTMPAVAATLSDVYGVTVTASPMTLEAALAAGMPGWGAGHDWINVVGFPEQARAESARELGIPMTSFADWARRTFTRP